ncbi:hypothetical protein GCM10029978_059170 [Actinoallomurus acanthiterrae]
MRAFGHYRETKRQAGLAATIAAGALTFCLAAIPTAGASSSTPSPHPAVTDPVLSAPVSSHPVPGITGRAAANWLTPAQRAQFRSRHALWRGAPTRHSPPSAVRADDDGHQFWAVYPTAGNNPTGVSATHSVLPNLRASNSSDVIYAPTMYPSGNACIEDTTAYLHDSAVIWAWDWCQSQTVGKLTVMDSAFQSTYVRDGAYRVMVDKTDAATNTWQMVLYNFTTSKWDPYFTSHGPNGVYNFGWDAFEVYSATNPSTGRPYICGDTAGSSFTASDIQQRENGTWKSLTGSDSTTDPTGTIFGCPSLHATFPTANSVWRVSNP